MTWLLLLPVQSVVGIIVTGILGVALVTVWGCALVEWWHSLRR